MSAATRLHPSLLHYIVNSLGWSGLLPLQERAIEPILAGRSALLIAPTAGGKTEAATFPLLTRMANEGWCGLSVLYVTPIKALLNNLAPRLTRHAASLGRRVDLWHGDIGPSARAEIDREPPDILLTTPESLEVILVSERRDHRRLLGHVRAVVVDEIHAFAGDDRGWHLLSVVERIRALHDRPLQRIGLSATVGNPEELLRWFCGSETATGDVVAGNVAARRAAEITIDHVGTIDNAGTVISQLHRGEKRLVFVDSRERCEKLSKRLRDLEVTTFVSHSSLGLDERRRAERAFAEARNCVIVATSTLELGIDVGDLDRVIQLDAPFTVASWLQRLGRSGRRPGTTPNGLFLCTDPWHLLRAGAIIRAREEGFVEPITTPPLPYHVAAHQLVVSVLQDGGIDQTRLATRLRGFLDAAAISAHDLMVIVDHMLAEGILASDQGVLGLGPAGEKLWSGKRYLDLFSVFTSDPLFRVLHGDRELGFVHEMSFQMREETAPILLLGGASWLVRHIDWARRQVWVESIAGPGISRWLSSSGFLSERLCRAMKSILIDGQVPATMSRRAATTLDELRTAFDFLREGSTCVEALPDGRKRWWTFAGGRANIALAAAIDPLSESGSAADDFRITLRPDAHVEDLRSAISDLCGRDSLARPPIDAASIEGIKFHACVPEDRLIKMLEERLQDPVAFRTCTASPIDSAGRPPTA